VTLRPRRDPAVRDPADRTRLAWTRTAIAFAALGAVLVNSSPLAGSLVLVLSVPVWAAARRMHLPSRSPRGPFLVSATVVVVALIALAITFLGPGPASLDELVHGR
jgi:uncharacterized membrane protein YidH (DUF202 family)